MKILFVDIQYDYGIKSRGPNSIGQDGFKSSFEKLGHEVIPFYYDEYLNNTNPLQKELLSFADKIKPDLIFFMIFRDHFKVETLEKLKEKYTTVNWFGDDTWRFDNYTSKYAPYFSWSITTDKFAIDKYKKLGVDNIFRSQWAAIDKHDEPSFDGDYKYDVTFIGAKHPYRKWFTDQLRKRDINVQCFGYGWDNGPLTNEEMNYIFRHSKINLNLANSNFLDLKYLLASPYNIAHAIKSTKTMSQIKARNFEIPYFGGFQLTDYVPTIEEYFEVGSEISCYSSLDEAELLIKYYLNNSSEREEIRLNGNNRSKDTHGYSNRISDFLKVLES